MRSVFAGCGIHKKIKIRIDASCVKSIASRKGVGKVWHIEVNQLWLEEKVIKGDIEIEKVPGTTYGAGAPTNF